MRVNIDVTYYYFVNRLFTLREKTFPNKAKETTCIKQANKLKP